MVLKQPLMAEKRPEAGFFNSFENYQHPNPIRPFKSG